MDILFSIHSILRWLVVIVGISAIVKFAFGWIRSTQFSGMDQGLSSGYAGLMDLQLSLGLILIIWSGLAGVGFPRYRIEHAITLILAVVIAHLPARWKSAADKVRFRYSFLAILVTMVLIYVGVAVLPGNRWSL